jgi:rhodanese-related sulfurtransferase
MNRLHAAMALTAATLAGGAAISDRGFQWHPEQLAAEIEGGRDHTSAIELADRIMRGDRDLLVFDLRSIAAFDEFHIPGARHAALRDLSVASFAHSSTVVLYSEGGAHAAQAWVLLRLRGYRSVFFLREGVYEWISRVLDPRLAVDATAAERAEFRHAAELSRYFGGAALSDVPRSEVPRGYWTGLSQDVEQPAAAAAQSRPTGFRRRGC